MNLVPVPQKITQKEGVLKADSYCFVSEDEAIKSFFWQSTKKENPCDVIFKNNQSLTEEGYRIDITCDSVVIEYSQPVGAFRALSTLKQIVSQCDGELPCLEIDDYPSIKNRGYMLDVSRGKLPKMSYLKKLIDILADLKYNQFQLYIDTFVYEFKNYPQYCKEKQPLSKEDIEELSKYCAQRFINLVPNVNSFGHMKAWLEKPELSHLGIKDENGKVTQTLNPLNEEVIPFIDSIYDGYIDVFDSEYVHIGMDEPNELGLGETKEACEKYGIGKVYTDYLKKVCNLAREKYNKKPMFWDDIVFKHEEQLENIPKDVTVMQWGYEAEHHFDRNCRKLKELGLSFYVCPGTSMWASITGRTNNAIANIFSAVENGTYYGAEGFLLTEWGDYGHMQFPSTSYLPLVIGASASWHSIVHNVEAAYAEKTNTIEQCKQYLNRYLFKAIQGDVADIAYRMGNYYLVEDELVFNKTHFTNFLDKMIVTAQTERQKKAFYRVRQYMLDLREELDQAQADEIVLRELKNDCDIVILFASTLCGEHIDPAEKGRIVEEFEELWKLNNKEPGMEYFNECMEKYIS